MLLRCDSGIVNLREIVVFNYVIINRAVNFNGVSKAGCVVAEGSIALALINFGELRGTANPAEFAVANGEVFALAACRDSVNANVFEANIIEGYILNVTYNDASAEV